MTILAFLFSFALIAYAEGEIQVSNETLVMKTLEEKILREAEIVDIDPQLALAVALCESRLDPGAKNPNSTASGIFQFIRSTWKSTLERMKLPVNLDVFDADVNIRVGVWLMKQDGAMTHWYPSASCWNKIINRAEKVVKPEVVEVEVIKSEVVEVNEPKVLEITLEEPFKGKINPFFFFIPRAFGWDGNADGLWR